MIQKPDPKFAKYSTEESRRNVHQFLRDSFGKPDPMTVQEARAKLLAVVKEITDAGLQVNGWDSGAIYIHSPDWGDQTWIDPENLDAAPAPR